MNILGISAYYHDSAAALIQEGNIIACAQEERFSRIKHDSAFPKNAITYCLQEAKIPIEKIDYIVFYDKPFLTFDRLLETYLTLAPSGFTSFLKAMPVWIKDKLFLKKTLKKALATFYVKKKITAPLLFTQHHQSHAASAFFPSPFEEAAVLCLDGVGEWATTSVWKGCGNTLTPQWEIKFPHSLGLLYSAFTYFTGFKVNSGEYKLMGLAPYGEPRYVDLILKNLIDVKEDGTYRLNMKYFDFATGLKMTNKRFAKLFGRPPRQPESPITQNDMDIARSIQVVTEDIVLKLAKSIRKECDVNHLCLAGGVALNCVANGKIWKEKIFDHIWIQPAAGDAGGALGAALSVWHEYLHSPRIPNPSDSMQGAYLGPQFSHAEIKKCLDEQGARYHIFSDDELVERTARLLAQQKVIGWFQGRMEFGPRALGNRSIIGDARSQTMQSTMNLKIKFRESFRPFAPAVLSEKVEEWFELNSTSPYMLLVANVNKNKYTDSTMPSLSGFEKCNYFDFARGVNPRARSRGRTALPLEKPPALCARGKPREINLKIARTEIPAVTHVDYSARVQTIHAETNPRFHQLLSYFEKLTQCPILINTSFNVRGEPIVCTPEEAFRCFMTTHMDCLVLGNIVLIKEEQPSALRELFKEGELVAND